MKLIDLTMPLYEGMPAGYGHMAFKNNPLWPDAFKMAETRSFDTSGSEFHVFSIFCEPGTRFILPSFMKEYRYGPTIDTVDIERIVLRDAVVLDVPTGAETDIAAEKLEEAFNKAPVKKGDALLVRTGWGNDERYLKMGHEYREKGPHYSAAAADKLMELLAKNQSDMWLYDNCDMGGTDKKTGQFYGFTIRDGLIAIGGIVNAGAITKPRVKLIISPMKSAGCHMGPARVVAVEE
ncbi:MAG: cyclase family protein [Dehalococcoidales bacterium]|nr:cyclase family protein [Dehalococcoidales bacterium]